MSTFFKKNNSVSSPFSPVQTYKCCWRQKVIPIASLKWHFFQISARCTSLFKGELVRFWHFSIRSFRVHVSYQTFYFQRLTLRSSVMQPNMWSIKVLWISRALLMQWLLRPGEDKNGRKWFGTKMERWVNFLK